MIKKNLILILIIIVSGCGFKPMLKNFDMNQFSFKEINISGKSELTYLFQNSLKIPISKNNTGYTINLNITESTAVSQKNDAGIVIEEDLIHTVNMEVFNENSQLLWKDIFSSSVRMIVNNNESSNFEKKRIERNKLINIVSNKTKFKLIMVLSNSK